ncbi:hypothetical protein CANARDRAFT_27467 [[Candida] arabinofermentans NRRL YB-2248]|uniref:UspA domain-containing protein n=1 Tax=[Candida] arabinofermentans NRRL YB-2248 TaxID=983967 RepID=A0A1E4T386_9ASCO|nr:hypothetical protein CANARDRAFT_27467 [[Candida] arabinofermentans NRRL YB-2248]
MYHLSQDEVDRLDSLNESEERLLLSPTSSGILSPQMSPIPKPTSSDHTSSLSSIPLLSSSSTASSMSGTRLMKESSPEPLGKLLPHHHIKKAPTPLQTANSFNKGVSFDNLSNELDFEKLQFTLTTKHQFFKFDRTSRVFMCGYDDHECSLTALKWAIDEMLNDGDTIVCLRVLTKETVMATNSGDKLKRDGAKILESIAKLNTQDKKIKIVLEFKVGRVPEMITLAIKEFEPVVLIVGTRGEKKSGFKAMISSKSMSKYCLQYARVPVVVVNPSYQPEYHDMAWRSSSAVDENTFKGKLTNFDTTTLTSDSVDSTAAVARRPRFMRVGSSSSTKRESSSDNTLSPSRSRGFSPARALSPFRMFKKK